MDESVEIPQPAQPEEQSQDVPQSRTRKTLGMLKNIFSRKHNPTTEEAIEPQKEIQKVEPELPILITEDTSSEAKNETDSIAQIANLQKEIEELRQNPNLEDPLMGFRGQLEKKKRLLKSLGGEDVGYPSAQELISDATHAKIDYELRVEGSSQQAENETRKRMILFKDLGRDQINALHQSLTKPEWQDAKELPNEKLADQLLFYKVAVANSFYRSGSLDAIRSELKLTELSDEATRRGITVAELADMNEVKKRFLPKNFQTQQSQRTKLIRIPNAQPSAASPGMNLFTGNPIIKW